MGDRASIRFWTNAQDEHPIGLYLHWGGGTYAEDLASALKTTESRWDDEEYATRMAVQSILEARRIGFRDLSAGLYVGTTDHGEEHPVLNVNWADQRVWSDEWTLKFNQFIRNDDNVWEQVQG